jgi:hypothetical protein
VILVRGARAINVPARPGEHPSRAAAVIVGAVIGCLLRPLDPLVEGIGDPLVRLGRGVLVDHRGAGAGFGGYEDDGENWSGLIYSNDGIC